MLRVGLTGGIGSGKSTVAARLGELGALVVDADRLAREVVAPGSEGLAAVAERFGADVLAADGGLDRVALGALVFADDTARRDLELITHPRIATRTRELLAAAAADRVVVHDVPLLVEKDLGPDYHLVLVVGADEDVRVQRLVRDRGLTTAQARARIGAQASDVQRRRAADVWLDNNDTPDLLRAAVDDLWRERLVPFEANVRAGIRARHPQVPTLVAHDERWPVQAARLLARLRRVLGDRAVAVEHVGSTSVPDLLAKDVLDLQVEVARLEEADRPGFVRDLAAAGFPRSPDILGDRPKPSLPDPLRWRKRFHASSDPGRLVHVHVREQGSAGARCALLLRDWLRAEPTARQEYADTKRRLAATRPTTGDYAAAKEPWFDAAYPLAQEWARESGWEARR